VGTAGETLIGICFMVDPRPPPPPDVALLDPKAFETRASHEQSRLRQ
jgi:hypothetical protein